MKSLLLSMSLILFVSGVFAQSSQEEKAVKQVIEKFFAAGDKQDASALDALIDPNYRVVMNQLFGSTDIMTLNKEVYLQKIRAKEFGGDKRKIEVHSIHVTGKLAVADVSSKGEKMQMRSFLNLVQDAQGYWKLIGDMPSIL